MHEIHTFHQNTAFFSVCSLTNCERLLTRNCECLLLANDLPSYNFHASSRHFNFNIRLKNQDENKII